VDRPALFVRPSIGRGNAAEAILVPALDAAGGGPRAAPSYPSEFASVLSVAAHEGREPFGLSSTGRLASSPARRASTSRCPVPGGGTIRSAGNSSSAARASGLAARPALPRSALLDDGVDASLGDGYITRCKARARFRAR
jgi:hypothetical protein